jgi:hypothetical protein
MVRTYGGRRSRVRIDTRANMRASLHIQHRRPNDRAYRAPNWNKHSLGQWVEHMGVGDPKCALMRAQTCAQPCTSSIDGQTTGPIEPQIRTNTHWGNGHKLWESACAQSGRRIRPVRARSARTSAKRESTGMEQGAATAASVKFQYGAHAARLSRLARSKTK